MLTIKNQEYLTVHQTSKRLEVSTKTVYRWISDGILDSIRFEGRRYVSVESIEDVENYR